MSANVSLGTRPRACFSEKGASRYFLVMRHLEIAQAPDPLREDSLSPTEAASISLRR